MFDKTLTALCAIALILFFIFIVQLWEVAVIVETNELIKTIAKDMIK